MTPPNQTYEGRLVYQGQKFALVVSRFNEFISSRLLGGALDALDRHGVPEQAREVFWVPGSFEIPLVAQELALKGRYQAVICLGAVIRGATPHFDLVAAEVAKGVAQAALSTHTPVIFGVITADTLEQAIERAGTKAGNKGWDAALAALEMSDLMRRIQEL